MANILKMLENLILVKKNSGGLVDGDLKTAILCTASKINEWELQRHHVLVPSKNYFGCPYWESRNPILENKSLQLLFSL